MRWLVHVLGGLICVVGGVALFAFGAGDELPVRPLLGVALFLGGLLWWFLAIMAVKPAPPDRADDAAAGSRPGALAPGDTVPALGGNAGSFRVVVATPSRLDLRARLLPMLALTIGGAALLAFMGGAVVLAVVEAIRGKRFSVPKMELAFAAVGLFAVALGLSRLGLHYSFDGVTRTAHRRKLIGRGQVWSAAEVSHVQLRVAPPDADPWAGRERLLVSLHGRGGADLIGHPMFGFVRTRTPGALVAAQAGITAARLLDVPVEVDGVVVTGTPELAALLRAHDSRGVA